MSKNDKTPVARKTRTKTPAQKAKALANIAAAQERLARLQIVQRKANELRRQGHIGSDRRMMLVASEIDRAAETKKAREFVDQVLSGPHADRVREFMGRGITGEPTKVAQIVRNFLNTQGLKVAC